MAVIVPHPDDLPDVLQSLLDLGVPAREIRSSSDYEYLALVVSDDVYDRWAAGSTKDEDSAPAPKRRGRPPKNPVPAPEESSPVDEETSP